MINTHKLVCDFGRHRGTPWTRIPVSYLRWLVNSAPERAAIAKAELERRGTVTPDMEITGHAIDRASQQLVDHWNTDKDFVGANIGFHSWLLARAQAARKFGRKDDQGRYHHEGVIFVFAEGEIWPVLQTVMRE